MTVDGEPTAAPDGTSSVDPKTVLGLVAELLRTAGEPSVDTDFGPSETVSLFVDLDDHYSVCLNNTGDTWRADIADLEEQGIVGYIETGLAVSLTDAETLAGAFKVHLDLARLDLKPYRI